MNSDNGSDEVGVIGDFALTTESSASANVGNGTSQGTLGVSPGEHTATGVFVLEQNELVDHPDVVVDPTAVVVNGVAAVSGIAVQDGEFSPTGSTQANPTEIGLTSVGEATNALVDFSSLEGNEGGVLAINEGVLEEYAETNGFIAANNILDENGQLSNSDDFLVSLGRWNAFDSSLTLNGESVDLNGDIHFGYA